MTLETALPDFRLDGSEFGIGFGFQPFGFKDEI